MMVTPLLADHNYLVVCQLHSNYKELYMDFQINFINNEKKKEK